MAAALGCMSPCHDATGEDVVAGGVVDAAALAGAVSSAEASRARGSLCWAAAMRCCGCANELWPARGVGGSRARWALGANGFGGKCGCRKVAVGVVKRKERS